MATEARRPFLQRLRDRLVDVLLFHPAELSEFLVGFVALVLGVVMALVGSPVGPRGEALWGGIALALFGLPQMVAAIWGRLFWRHVSNMLGAFAALANVLRAAKADVPLAYTFYFLIFVCCLFFWGRTYMALIAKRPESKGARW